jgi:hypothetical protein
MSKRISEWIAFGGERLHQIGITNTRNTGRRAFQRPFYWDLWKDIRDLREEAFQVTRWQLSEMACNPGRSMVLEEKGLEARWKWSHGRSRIVLKRS